MNHQGFTIPSLWNLDIGYKVSSRESGLTQIAKKLLAHAIFVSTFFLLSDWGKNFHPSMCMLHLTKIDICAFSRRIYPKRLTVHSGCTFFVSMCAAWEFNPQPFALLSNAMPYLWGTQLLKICRLHIHDANLPFHHIPKLLYWIEIWWLWRPF